MFGEDAAKAIFAPDADTLASVQHLLALPVEQLLNMAEADAIELTLINEAGGRHVMGARPTNSAGELLAAYAQRVGVAAGRRVACGSCRRGAQRRPRVKRHKPATRIH